MAKKMISIWFFVGLILTVYGVLILGAGIAGLLAPEPPAVVLGKLHAGVWWGGLLIVVGAFYVVRFRPRKTD